MPQVSDKSNFRRNLRLLIIIGIYETLYVHTVISHYTAPDVTLLNMLSLWNIKSRNEANGGT